MRRIVLLLILLACTACGLTRQNQSSPSERYAWRTGSSVPSAPPHQVKTREKDKRQDNSRDREKEKEKQPVAPPAADVQARPDIPETVSLQGHQTVQYAKEFLGKPYKYAGNGPDSFDCSGFTCYVYKHFGITLPRVSRDQYSAGRPIDDPADIQPGDLVFYARNGRVFHVGIAVENRGNKFTFIHASNAGVILTSSDEAYWAPKYYGARRIY